MRIKIIESIFRKELKEFARDTSTVLVILLYPLLMYPLLLYFLNRYIQTPQYTGSKENVKTSILLEAKSPSPSNILYEHFTNSGFDVKVGMFNIDSMYNQGISFGIIANDNSSHQIVVKMVTINVNNSELINQKYNITKVIQNLNEKLLKIELEKYAVEDNISIPILLEETNIVKSKIDEKLLTTYALNVLVSLSLFFIFVGVLYISIDITAGEHERKTLQTLLATPINSIEILLGKLIATSIIGILTLFINGFIIFVSLKFIFTLPINIDFSLNIIDSIIILSILLSSVVVISSTTLSFMILSKSLKSAQSYTYPLLLFIVVLSSLAYFPNMNGNNFIFCIIPLLNTHLGILSILFDQSNYINIILIIVSNLSYAILGLSIGSFLFQRSKLA